MMPSLFIAHGAPTLVLEDNGYTKMLQELRTKLPRPRAIVLFSAHWEAPVQTVSAVEKYDMIYDFYGFPEEMYKIVYPAKGEKALAEKVRTLLDTQEIASRADTERGMDHGAWVVLRLVYPQADIPVVVLSVNPNLSAAEQYRIGQALSPLRKDGVMFIGSGGTVHNLRRINWRSTEAEEWAVKFDDWLGEKIGKWDTEALFAYETQAPHAKEAVPRNEHFIPLLLAMGAADDGRNGTLLHREYQYGNLSLICWKFD
ncbi:dioxygenase [Aneurinibacillus danicus]|uniref:Dioxygenase n=2 Tax=Aneurinibacillus danicus TaxID=267746 RepID=A0A511V3R6_9BACL|nr:dioxygenase [Aneurinibacillus danicus]